MEDMMVRVLLVLVLFLISTAVQAAGKPLALIVSGIAGSGMVQQVTAKIEAAGYAVRTAEADALDTASMQSVDLLVLADGSRMPASAGKPIQAYLESGGNIIALRTPLWQTSMVKLGDKWVTKDEYQIQTASILPEHVILDFKAGSTADWIRSTDNQKAPTTYEAGTPGPTADSNAFHAKIVNLTSWETFGTRGIKDAFPKGHTLTVFSAKGGPRTTQIAVEWAEKDGARWIATIPVDQKWRRYVLRPEDFKYWNSNPARGGRGDKFNPENAVDFCVGLAFTHTGSLGGDHEFWAGPVGTAAANDAQVTVSADPDFEPADLLYPGYKFFESTGVASVKTADGLNLPASGTIFSSQPRPEGRGIGKGRNWRYISLATAYTAKGEWRGAPAAMMVHTPDSPYKGGVWASFGFQDEKAYQDSALLSLIQKSAERIRRGLFFLEAGTDFYTYHSDQEVKRGAVVMNLSDSKTSGLTIDQKIIPIGNEKIVAINAFNLDVEPNASESVSGGKASGTSGASKLPLESWPAKGIRVITQLIEGREVIDEISHEAYLWKPKPKKQFMTTADGNFELNGKPWKAHGVNYMPSSGIGAEDGDYFEHWIGARAYDPEIIQRDLDHIKDMRMNSISIFVYNGHHLAGNVLDILRRCENLGIKVNLSLRPGTPFDFQWDKIREIIERDKLWDNDTVYAYDLAWEPMFPRHDGRKQWDAEWDEWIKERYKSIENAEADWGYPVPREDGKITNPPDSQFVADGEWKRMVAAYRRFLDDILYRYYNRARTLVKSVDPNHLVSFRMTEAGNPTYNWDQYVPYDFAQLAAAVDFLAPEAYGRIGEDWEKVKPGWFEREYARWAASDKPMIWAEVGVSTWDNSWMHNTDEKFRFQKVYFEQFYKMLIGSRANGIYFWWYPGGFRCGENSDFGIINPDGSDRLSTRVIRDNARTFLKTVDQPTPDNYITFDRDTDPRGIYGIHERAKDEFWKLIESGKKPGLKTAGTGTTSADCPLVAVGNTRYDGKAPLKYLNSAFDKLEILDFNGKWIEVKSGTEVTVDRNKPVVARAVVRNLGEAKWIAGEGKGCVEMVCHIGFGHERTALPSDVSKHDTTEINHAVLSGKGPRAATTVHIYMRAKDRGDFGEVVKVRLVPG